MPSVFFRFQDNASEENQDQVRQQLLKLPGVRLVERISPDAKKDALRRLWYADVSGDQAATDLLTQLRNHDDIRSADLPPKRGLV
jgi:cell division protein FtsX